MRKIDWGAGAVAVVTLILFVVALFEKGFTHDLLLEAGVFLVSVKLMLMMHKNEVVAGKLDAKLETILAALKKS